MFIYFFCFLNVYYFKYFLFFKVTIIILFPPSQKCLNFFLTSGSRDSSADFGSDQRVSRTDPEGTTL